MTEEKTPSAAMTLKKYFGNRPGQTTADFIQELKDLTAEDKEQLSEGIKNGSETY